jgi:phosphoribosylformylglycinamidine synthase
LAAPPPDLPRVAWLFGEDQGRYLVATGDAAAVLAAAQSAAVPACVVGLTGGVALTLPGAGAISIGTLEAANEAWLPAFLAPG